MWETQKMTEKSKTVTKVILAFIAGIVVGALALTICNISFAKELENRQIMFIYENEEYLPVTLSLKDIDYDAKVNVLSRQTEIVFNEDKLNDFINNNFFGTDIDIIKASIVNKLYDSTDKIDLALVVDRETFDRLCYNSKISNLNITLYQKDKTGLDDIVIKATDLMDKTEIGYEISNEKVNELLKTINNQYKIRQFINCNGENITVPYCSQTHFGWKVDTKELNKLLYDALKDIYDKIDVPFASEGNVFSETNGVINDIGDTYIEISINNQHLWYFKDGQCVFDCDVVTGKDKTPTPKGVFNIRELKTNETMRGSYGTAFAQYWLRLTDSGIGIHAADWRGSFGGSIYRASGSHGCINVSVANSRWLYENIEKGIPVVIY